MPARELAERMGHSKASMSLDTYTHVMAPEEANRDGFGPDSAVKRRAGVVSVWS